MSQFWPLIAVIGVVSLIIGYMMMLPDDFENLSESVVAASFFGNNVLEAITTRNYWDIGNIYKPLMHTWYIGVLLQCFVFLAIIIWLTNKISKKNLIKKLLFICGFLSFLLYFSPFFSSGDKFYLPQFRLYEIIIGTLVVYAPKYDMDNQKAQFVGLFSVFVIIFVIFSGISLPSSILMLIVLLATFVVIFTGYYYEVNPVFNDKISNIISLPGKYSYDIYIWHQVIIAFLYYFVFQTLNFYLIIFVLIITTICSMIYVCIRKKLSLNYKTKIIISFVVILCSTVIFLFIYNSA